MSIVKSDTLSYFYNKIKQVFARSVNGKQPDLETGDISITNIETANNLVGGDAVEFFGEFSFRTAGGSAQITSGEATLAYIEGNTIRTNAVEESWEIESTNNLEATITNIEAWRSQINESVTNYSFSFINSPPDGSYTAPNWWAPSETDNMWAHNGTGLNIISYGITTNAIMPSLTVNVTSSTISSVSINPHDFTSQISTGDIYEFLCTDEDGTIVWTSSMGQVTLSNYGITITGTAADGDKITVTYVAGTPNSAIITVNYTAPDSGLLKSAKPLQFIATGYNQFNLNNSNQIIANATINNEGEIISNTGTYVCFCRAASSPHLGYLAYTPTGTISNAGQCLTLPAINVVVDVEVKNELDLAEQHIQSRTIQEDGYFVVATDTIADLCIHTRWDNEEDFEVAAYAEPSVITLPLYAKDGTTPLNISTIGMSSVGTVADKLIFGNDTDASGSYIKKIGVVINSSTNMSDIIAYGTDYIYDDNNIYYVLKSEDQVTYQISCSGTYEVNDFGTEEFIYADGADEIPLKVETLYGENLRNKLKGDVVTISTPLEDPQKISVLKNLGFSFSADNKIITSTPVPIETYKVGDIFITTRSGTPKTLLGYGEWSQITDRFLYGVASGATGTGGNASGGNITLTTANIPKHRHEFGYAKNTLAASSGSGAKHRAVNSGSSEQTGTGYTSYIGGDGDANGNTQSFSIMPPYYKVYIWRRTS